MNDAVASEPDAPSPPTESGSPRTSKPPFSIKRLVRGVGGFFVDTYATADPRSLALFRIALGALLFFDVARRWPDLAAHYSNEGWLTNHFALFRPMSNYLFSIYLAFSTVAEVKLMVCVHLMVNVALMLGWRTRLMHVLAAVLIASLNNRNILLENGGYVVLTLLTVWGMFLPTGRRFSVDAFLASWRAQRETRPESLNQPSFFERRPVVSLAVTALLLQWFVIYAFNVVHKNGQLWRDGTAVHYFFEQDRMVTAFGAWARSHLTLPIIKSMTWGALATESLIALLLVFPLWTRFTRMAAWFLCMGLHLSIDSVVQLGPFSYAMITAFFVFIPREFWTWLEARLRQRRQARYWFYDPEDGLSLQVCRVLRRFDSLQLVRFEPRALRRGDEGTGEDEGPRTLGCAGQAPGEPLWFGVRAFHAVVEALPLPYLATTWTRWPFIAPRVAKFFESDATRRAELSNALGLAALPHQPERAVKPSPFRLRLQRLARIGTELAVALLLVVETSQVLVENSSIPAALKPKSRPAWMEAIVIYPRLFQGWSMFAPGPPTSDGRLVVDGRTADGRRLDPLTGKEPNFDMEAPDGFAMDQIWGDFHRRIAESRFSAYHQGLRDMLKNYHKISGIPENRLVSFDVYFISQATAPPGARHLPTTKNKLFSSDGK